MFQSMEPCLSLQGSNIDRLRAELQTEFRDALLHAYHGPRVDMTDRRLPSAFEADERSDLSAPDILQLLSGRCAANVPPRVTTAAFVVCSARLCGAIVFAHHMDMRDVGRLPLFTGSCWVWCESGRRRCWAVPTSGPPAWCSRLRRIRSAAVRRTRPLRHPERARSLCRRMAASRQRPAGVQGCSNAATGAAPLPTEAQIAVIVPFLTTRQLRVLEEVLRMSCSKSLLKFISLQICIFL